MLLKRIISGIILIFVALAAIFYLPQLGFEIVLAVIMLACAWEWTNLMHMKNPVERVLYLVIIALLFYAVTWVAMGYFLYTMFIGMLVLIALVNRYQTSQGQMKLPSVWWYIIGVLMLVTCWYSINIIRFRVSDLSHLIILLLIVWAADIAAFFTGKYFGKTKLCSFVSPNKSWEGFKGAAMAVFVLTMIQGVYYKMDCPHFLMTTLINMTTFVAAVYGDLFESMMKRMADVKDSGSIIPGHGGLLDRLDSLFFAAPCYATGIFIMALYLK